MIPERFVVAFSVGSDVPGVSELRLLKVSKEKRKRDEKCARKTELPEFRVDDKKVSKNERKRARKWVREQEMSAEQHHINFIRSREEALKKWHAYQKEIWEKYGLIVKAPYAVRGVVG